MAYTINKTDGTILATIADGTVDTTTNLSLFGKNYAGYGELLNENQVKLLENFANTTANAPDKPVIGQLFYDTTLNQIQVYDGTVFKASSGSIISATEPTFGAEGDLGVGLHIKSADSGASVDGNADEFLQTNGSGVLTWAAAGGGITEADMFRLTADLTSNSNPISSNLERVDDATFSKIGTGMSLSSGILLSVLS